MDDALDIVLKLVATQQERDEARAGLDRMDVLLGRSLADLSRTQLEVGRLNAEVALLADRLVERGCERDSARAEIGLMRGLLSEALTGWTERLVLLVGKVYVGPEDEDTIARIWREAGLP